MLVGVDQVDVGTEVQLAAAELAQAEHDQPLRARRRWSRAPRRGVARTRLRARRARPAGSVSASRVLPASVSSTSSRPSTSRQTSRVGFGRAVAAQQRRPVARGSRRSAPAAAATARRVGAQPRQQIGLAQQRIDREVAGDAQRGAAFAAACGTFEQRSTRRRGASAGAAARVRRWRSGRHPSSPRLWHAKSSGRPKAAACVQRAAMESVSTALAALTRPPP